jgi:hypothetical protein
MDSHGGDLALQPRESGVSLIPAGKLRSFFRYGAFPSRVERLRGIGHARPTIASTKTRWISELLL